MSRPPQGDFRLQIADFRFARVCNRKPSSTCIGGAEQSRYAGWSSGSGNAGSTGGRFGKGGKVCPGSQKVCFFAPARRIINLRTELGRLESIGSLDRAVHFGSNNRSTFVG